MFKSPYETTVCRTHRVQDIVKDFQEMMISGELVPFVGDHTYHIPLDDKQTKPFAHPMVVENRNDNNQSIIVDLRGVARNHPSSGELSGGSDLEFARKRVGLMSMAWVNGSPKDLLNTGTYQITIFSTLISENLGRRMNLNIETQVRVRILAAFYYICLFEQDRLTFKGNEDPEYLKFAKIVSRAVRVPLDKVLEVTDPITEYNIERIDMEAFCALLREYSGSVRLDKLKPAVVYTMLGGVWFGANNVETVAVSLEHPPTFVAMLHQVMNDRGYRKTILGQLHDQVGRRNDVADEFSKHVDQLLKGHH